MHKFRLLQEIIHQLTFSHCPRASRSGNYIGGNEQRKKSWNKNKQHFQASMMTQRHFLSDTHVQAVIMCALSV